MIPQRTVPLAGRRLPCTTPCHPLHSPTRPCPRTHTSGQPLKLPSRAHSSRRSHTVARTAASRVQPVAGTDRYVVPAEAKEFFLKFGFVKLEGVMSEEEMQQEIDPWYHKYLRRELEPLGKDLCDMSGVKGRTPDEFTVYNVMLPRTYNPAQQNNLFERRCKSIADQLQGGGMAIDYDQILAKRPQSADSIFAWHQDMAYWPPFTSSTATATCWLAVTDSTLENGCMRFVKGSSSEPELRRHAPVGSSREDSHALCTKVDEATEPIEYIPLSRGSITVHNERVVHGSGPNKSKGWRNAYVLAFRKEECIAEERSLGFTHSHNDTHSWDAFQKWESLK